MSTPRRYLIVEHGVPSAAFNLLLNGVIAWVTFRGAAQVSLWGQPGIAFDTLATTFVLPFLTCLIVTRMATEHVRRGHVMSLGWTRETHPLLGYLPTRTFTRAVALGVVGVLTVGLPTVSVLSAVGVGEMALGPFLLFKAVFAGVIAGMVQPVIAFWVIAQAVEAGRSP